jgi:hypothetical protein
MLSTRISLLMDISDLENKNRKFGPLNGNRGPGRGKHFLNAYGFDSQTPGAECFASYSYTLQGGNVDNTMVTDHGFRVLDDDPYVPPPCPDFRYEVVDVQLRRL